MVDFTSRAIATELGKTPGRSGHGLRSRGRNYSRAYRSYAIRRNHFNSRDTVFESVLEYTARSLKQHGFTEIYFLGDSGGNQESQRIVAEKLAKEWLEQGVRVATIDEYYSANGQFDSLKEAGYSDGEIGFHAGMRDTSELLAIDDQTVRLTERNLIKGVPPGFSGAASKASVEIGQQMLVLKIQAALRQIRSLRTKPIDQLNQPQVF